MARVIASKYRLIEQLGQGGMGSVWSAEHLALGSRVAIKFMAPELAVNPQSLARFRREAQAAALLDSPHIVEVFDFGVDRSAPYIVMQLLRGESLHDRLQRLGRLSLGETVDILVQVARGVGRAHESGIAHRDLKPENIFLMPDDDRELVKVIDFGIAKRVDRERLPTSGVSTETGTVLGTPYYMSPEQVTAKAVDVRTDIWSFGVITFVCVTGKRPFDGESRFDLYQAICQGPIPHPSGVVECPQAFDDWFAHCVSRDPGERFGSIREAAQELGALVRDVDESFALPPHSARQAAPSTEKRSRPDSLLEVAPNTKTIEPLPGMGSAAWPSRVGVAAAAVAVALVGGAVGSIWWIAGAPAVPATSAAPSAATNTVPKLAAPEEAPQPARAAPPVRTVPPAREAPPAEQTDQAPDATSEPEPPSTARTALPTRPTSKPTPEPVSTRAETTTPLPPKPARGAFASFPEPSQPGASPPATTSDPSQVARDLHLGRQRRNR